MRPLLARLSPRALALCALALALPLIAVGQPRQPTPAQPAHPARPGRTPAPAAPPPPPIVPRQVERLPNGLTVITIPWDSPGIVAYYTLVRVGSRDEVEPGHSGFAHLFEHMMFRGTARFPAEVYERTMQSLGADGNAYTTNDFTLYTITTPASGLDRLVELEADRFQHLQYSEPQFRTETGAVLGEYNKSASDPGQIMDETMSELAFTRHTYRHTVIGYLADVRAMPGYYAYSQNFFRRFYTPDDCTLFVVGDFDRAHVMDLVRRHYGGWRGRRAQPRIPVEPEPTAGGERHLDWEGSSPPRMWVSYRAPGFQTASTRPADRERAIRETAALQVVHALAFHESSPLYQRLVVRDQRVLALGSYAGWFSRDPGLFQIQATLKPGEPFPGVRDEIQAELDRIAHGDTPAERVDAVKSHLRYGLWMGLETPDQVADLFASYTAVSGADTSVEQYLQALATVTPQEVAETAARYLATTRRFVVTLAPRPAAAPPAGGAAPTPAAAAGQGGAR